MSEEQKRAAWEKTSKTEYTYNFKTYALSPEGAWVCKEDYGKTNTHGWSVDHWDGNDKNNKLDNLRAMQWKNNNSKGNKTNCYIRKVYAITNSNTFQNGEKDKEVCLTDSPRKDQ